MPLLVFIFIITMANEIERTQITREAPTDTNASVIKFLFSSAETSGSSVGRVVSEIFRY